MKKKLYHFLKIFLGADIGVFLGYALYEVIWYRAHPEFYMLTSAPWYTGILLHGLLAVLIAAVLIPAMWLLNRKSNKVRETI